MTVEIIADGIHLHPAVLKLAVAARGPRDIALITDAVTAAGMPDGTYEFIKRRVQVADGSVRLADGTLAGSVLTVDRAVRNTVALAGTSWSDALRMATKTYTAQLAILAIFAAAWNGNSERMSELHAQGVGDHPATQRGYHGSPRRALLLYGWLCGHRAWL